jgi:hypothetical protein
MTLMNICGEFYTFLFSSFACRVLLGMALFCIFMVGRSWVGHLCGVFVVEYIFEC